MQNLGNHIQQADWKTEKHVPVIECPDTVNPGVPHALAYCNIHGLWENSRKLAVSA